MDNKNTKLKSLLKPILIVFSFLLIIYLVTIPVFAKSSESFIENGDKFLLEKRFVSAEIEYEKAFFLNHDKKAEDRIDLAKRAEKDVFALELFYREKNSIKNLDIANQVKKVPDSERECVTLAKSLIEKNEPQFAEKSAEVAIEMDKNYRDAWLYAGIAELKIADTIELSAENRRFYQGKARESLEKAKSLDPTYEPTLEYLRQI